MDGMERKVRLAEIPKLIEIEHQEVARLTLEIERLESQRDRRAAAARDLQQEEIRLLREQQQDEARQ